MLSLRKLAAAAALLALVMPAAASAQGMSSMPDLKMNEPTRFSAPGVYTGKPALPVTLSMIIAGGGPSNFNTVTLLKTLTGPKFDAELAKLTNQYGKEKIGNFVTVFNFVVSDSLRIVTANHVALPKEPSPDPKNGEALAGALWGAGDTPNGFNVEVMLDRAVSHPIHVQVMKDIDAKYGVGKDADYHAILNSAMHDLAAAYHLNAQGQPSSM